MTLPRQVSRAGRALVATVVLCVVSLLSCDSLKGAETGKLLIGWASADITPVYWHLARAVRFMDRYELQHTDPKMSVPIHVVRIGDMAIATFPLAPYLDFGIQIKARSKAVQTFTVQTADRHYRYLPTERSLAGGAYGAVLESTVFGPKGGRELVEQTLELIESLWASPR